MLRWIQQRLDSFRVLNRLSDQAETMLLLQGRMLSHALRETKRIQFLGEVEFKVFSQFGDDGIIQWLVQNLEVPHKTFVEFGVEDYHESNTRFLMMNDNWAGFVMDGLERNVSRIRRSPYFWRYSLKAKSAFITRENINSLLLESEFDPEIGILHVDLDGVDYWIWDAINVIKPVVVILEYNSVFGDDRAITIPYDAAFSRSRAHFSRLYWGASLPALRLLCSRKGYDYIGSNSAGNNAYFVRTDKINSVMREAITVAGYVESKFRESRSRSGKLSHLAGANRLDLLRGLPVFNVITGKDEPL